MRAVVFDEVLTQPDVREVAKPQAPVGGVVVKVLATGMCRSDWHAWAGHDDIAMPHVPGHELAGVIDAVGEGVQRWKVGDRVTVPFVCGCGACEWCLAGDAQVCPDQQQPGFTHWGSQVKAGEWVTVVGAGGVGLSAVMIAKAMGARVIAVDRNPEALAVAARLGADHTVLADGADIPAAINGLSGGGSHVAVDAVGSEQTCADAILSLRRRGRHVQIGLLPSIDGNPQVPMARVIGWELDLLGSHGMAAVDYPGMMALIEQGALQPQLLIERTIGLEDAAALLPGFDQANPAGMTMVDPAR